MGVGAGSAIAPALAAVQRRVVARRGLASCLAAAGTGVGTALLPLGGDAVTSLRDWRAGLLALAGLVALLGPLGAAVMAQTLGGHAAAVAAVAELGGLGTPLLAEAAGLLLQLLLLWRRSERRQVTASADLHHVLEVAVLRAGLDGMALNKAGRPRAMQPD